MEFNRYELLQIYSGLEKVWKERLRQASYHKSDSDKHSHFTNEAREVDKVRKRISEDIKFVL